MTTDCANQLSSSRTEYDQTQIQIFVHLWDSGPLWNRGITCMTFMHMRDAKECINSNEHGLFAVIKAIFSNRMILKLIAGNIFRQLAYILHTDLSDLNIVVTCDILVYQLHHEVMWWSARLFDSNLLSICFIPCHWNCVFDLAMCKMFS